MRRRAFSIAELMLVLAVILVAAGVSYPVFAHARDSAHTATCASNFRSVGMAVAMYAADYEDRFPPVNYQPVGVASSANDRTWVQLVLPYSGSFGVFACPSDGSQRPRPEATFDKDLVPGDTVSQYYTASMRTNLGYNFQYLAPMVRDGERWLALPRSTTQIAQPSRMLLLVDSLWSRDAAGMPAGGGSWLVVPPCRFRVDAQGNTIDTFIDVLNDTQEVFTTFEGWQIEEQSSPVRYGGAWPWHRGRLTVARVDGSAAKLPVSSLHSGCDVREEWRGNIVDEMSYLWSPR